ncbi:hypothetical protein OH76DRAFT_1405493 [Lentinus brumalis]|uniref:VanZ-like domain-containing protein n=1 Tax=Lentinus brumalis TaxID=2498619 RepID=A0A371D5Z1_9APHY|nr:hypothetical protein OH76DRAFT_1405493 [Polyporus brumalis]
MIGLPDATSTSDSEPLWTRTSRSSRKALRKMNKAVMRSHHFRIPKYDMPLRLRPWFLLFTCLILLSLAFLGFTNFAHSLPINDKLLHFFCMGSATAVFYFIFDVEEDARRIWFWRSAPLIFTGVVCFFFGGIMSEFVQSMLPYKEFQAGDVAANLLGSTLGLYVAYHLERYYRHRREISRLYRPLDTDSIPSDDEEDDDEPGGTQLLPLHHSPSAPRTPNSAKSPRSARQGPHKAATRLSDVWDEREELFDIGEESEDDEPRTAGGLPPPPPPKIVVTGE